MHASPPADHVLFQQTVDRDHQIYSDRYVLKMKIIQSMQKFALHLGISVEQSIQKHPFNRRNVLALFVFGSATNLCALHVAYDEHTFSEYTIGIAAFSSMFVATTIFVIVLWRMRPLFECLCFMEEAITRSKLRYLFTFYS